MIIHAIRVPFTLIALEISPFILRTFAGPMIETKGFSINISFLETIFSSYEIFVSSHEIFVSSYEISFLSYDFWGDKHGG